MSWEEKTFSPCKPSRKTFPLGEFFSPRNIDGKNFFRSIKSLVALGSDLAKASTFVLSRIQNKILIESESLPSPQVQGIRFSWDS